MAQSSFTVVVVVLAFGFLGIFSGLTSASAICKCSNSGNEPPKEQKVPKVERFKVHVNELGLTYNEEVEVDTEKETQRYHVPAHRDISEADYLYDFKMNLTMIRKPTEKTCLLMKTDPNVARPRVAKAALDQMGKSLSKAEPEKVTSSWRYSNAVVDRSALSDELAEFCAKYPIIHLDPVKDSTSVEIEDDSPRRVRRQSTNNWCNKNVKIHCKMWEYECKINTKDHCVFIIVKPCELVPALDNGDDSQRWKCKEDHLIYSVLCCDPYCP